MSDQFSSERPRPRRARAIAGVLIVALAGGLVGAFVSQSFSQVFAPAFGPPWHRTLTSQQMADRADRMVRHLAIEIDANADQQAKLEAIVKSAVGDLVPMRDKMFAARQQMHNLLTQTTIDRAAIEQLRAEQIATVDALSKRIAQAVGDAADVLTPDQRRKLGEMLPPGGRPGYWHPWHHG